jgi:hypothetical protein
MKTAKRWGAAIVFVGAWMALAAHFDAEKFEQPQADRVSKSAAAQAAYSTEAK